MTKFRFEQNGFDYIRYYAAFSVMLLHFTGYMFNLGTGDGLLLTGLRQITLLFPGVVILFALSGFLVAGSMERMQSVKLFFQKRILRLYPELWLCTLFNLLVLFLLIPQKLDKSILLWLFTQIFGIANTPSCLEQFATGSVNGALWTIFVEIQFYILLGFFYQFLKN